LLDYPIQLSLEIDDVALSSEHETIGRRKKARAADDAD
jgi:hypothetical protein